MKLIKFSKFTPGIFVMTLLALQPQVARGGGQGFNQSEVSSDLGVGKFSSNPFHVSVTARGGYDDNVNLSSINPQDSFFANTALNITYDFGSPRTRLSLNAGSSFTYYFDQGDSNNLDSGARRDYDINAWASFGITHKATPRLTLGASLYATYQTQPDFTNLSTFNNSFSFTRRNQNFFFTVDKFSAAYAWTPRFSTLSSYTFGATDYVDGDVGRFEDRYEHTFGNEFRFLIQPTTTLVAEYRFGFIDFTGNDFRDSTSHFLLAGIDHSFSPRFNISARGGVEFRDYYRNPNNFLDGSSSNNTSPYGEATLNYALAQNTSISFTNRYSIEVSDVPEFLDRQTYRTGLSVRHAFTSRISSGLGAFYQHDDYAGNGISNGFTEDSYEISLSARYAINRNWSIDAGYTHTEVIADSNLFREYSRNRYYAGATFSF